MCYNKGKITDNLKSKPQEGKLREQNKMVREGRGSEITVSCFSWGGKEWNGKESGREREVERERNMWRCQRVTVQYRVYTELRDYPRCRLQFV